MYIGRSLHYLIGAFVFYAIVALLALASIGFLYLFLFRMIAATFDSQNAAAIISIGTILTIGLMILVRLVWSKRRSTVGRRPYSQRARTATSELDPAMELGRGLAKGLRISTPALVVGLAAVGALLYARPQMLKFLIQQYHRRD